MNGSGAWLDIMTSVSILTQHKLIIKPTLCDLHSDTSNSLQPCLSCRYSNCFTYGLRFVLNTLLGSQPLPGWIHDPTTLLFLPLHFLQTISPSKAHFHVIMPVFTCLTQFLLALTCVPHCLWGTFVCMFPRYRWQLNASKIGAFSKHHHISSLSALLSIKFHTPTKSSAIANLLDTAHCFLPSRDLLCCQITL